MAKAMFGRSMEELVDRYRVEVLAEADRLRGMRGLIGPDADMFGTRVERALAYIAVNAPLRADRQTPPAFTELRIAAIESLTDRRQLEAAKESVDRLEKRVASVLKQEYPALAEVDLGVDDLMEMARAGMRLSAERSRKADGIAVGEKGTFLERVKARLSGDEIERLRTEAKDINPRNPHASRAAVAEMALEAMKERRNAVPMALDPRPERGRKPVTASAYDLMKFAAANSGDLTAAQRDYLRVEIARDRRNVELASDVEEARREIEEHGLAFSWRRG